MWFNKKFPDNLTERDKYRLIAYIGYSNSDMDLVGQYRNAINILINQIVEEKSRIGIIACPLLYLMCHTIELALKENIRYLKEYSKLDIGKLKTHALDELLLNFEKHYNKIATENNFNDELKNEYNNYLSELKSSIVTLGVDSSSFRYIYSADESKETNCIKTINVFDLKNKFDKSMIFLIHISDAISQYTDYIDYTKFDKTIKNDSLGIVLYRFDKSRKDWLIEKLNEEHKIINPKLVWFDEKEKYFIHLKLANKKCYAIPMRK